MSGVWLTDLADILRKAGVQVKEMTYTRGPYQGMSWKRVGFGGRGLREFRGIMWHHDASPPGDSPGALDWCMFMDIAPAAAAWIDRRGVWHLYAAGLSNHAGVGASALAPNSTGNQYYFGIETDHTTNETWSQPQLDSLRKGTAAIFAAYGLDARKALEFHKTYAPGRKNDPDGLDLERERAVVHKLMSTPSRNERKADKLARRRRRTRIKINEAKEAGESYAGLPTQINRLTERIKRLRRKG